MLETLRIRLNNRKLCQRWRQQNAHNETWTPTPLFSPECVRVGNGTYGAINVEMARKDCFLTIGNYCSIANSVTFILSSEHRMDTISTFPFKVKVTKEAECEGISKGNIVVCDDVWIGFGSTILSGVTIGQGAVIAAGSVVTKDVPPYAIVAGIPARVIKYRFTQELNDELLRIDYSKLQKTQIYKNIDKLYLPLTSPRQLDWLPKK